MGLSIRVKKGSEIEIGEHTLIVLEAYQLNVKYSFDSGPSVTLLEENGRHALLSDVFISIGLGTNKRTKQTRLHIEAPRSMRIEHRKP